MGIMDKLSAGAERAAKEAEKAFEKGKAKVGELQIEMQMDGLAKKLGYLVFDFYRGREVDQARRQQILDELSRLEDQLAQARAEAEAKAQAESEAKPRPPAGTGTEGAPPQAQAEAAPTSGTADATARGEEAPGPPWDEDVTPPVRS